MTTVGQYVEKVIIDGKEVKPVYRLVIDIMGSSVMLDITASDKVVLRFFDEVRIVASGDCTKFIFEPNCYVVIRNS